MKHLWIGAAMLGFGTGTVAAQTVHIDAYGVAVTDRRSGQVEEGAARGFGGGGRVTGTLGAFAAEVNVYAARLSVEPSSSRRDLLQLEVRGQLRVFPVLSLELSAVHRSMTPDVEGTEFGFVSAGAHADISVSTWGRFWGRLALIPLASFSGGATRALERKQDLASTWLLLGSVYTPSRSMDSRESTDGSISRPALTMSFPFRWSRMSSTSASRSGSATDLPRLGGRSDAQTLWDQNRGRRGRAGALGTRLPVPDR